MLKGLNNYLPLHSHVPVGCFLILSQSTSPHGVAPRALAFLSEGTCSYTNHAVRDTGGGPTTSMNTTGFWDPWKTHTPAMSSHSAPPSVASAATPLAVFSVCVTQSDEISDLLTGFISSRTSWLLRLIPRLASRAFDDPDGFIIVLTSLHKITHSTPKPHPNRC
jgi:hypothetical protein